MKKIVNYILIIAIIMTYFIPFNYINVKADSIYTVSIIRTNGNNEQIGSYGNYYEAKNVMNNYKSDENNVAVIYKDSKIINARYAIATLLGSSPISLYTNVSDSSEYTSTHPNYGKEAAFIDYDPNTNRVKIMISGFTGWTSLNNVDVTPITNFGGTAIRVNDTTTSGINIRTDHSTSSSIIGVVTAGTIHRYYDKYYDGTYTWYKIYYNNQYGYVANNGEWTTETNISSIETYYQHYKSGNLIHYFKYFSTQSYTNLGPSPSYLTKSINYYSFDGNYFYKTLTSMLDDYRNNTRNNAVNKEPWYPYYLYLPNHTKTGYTADDFNQIIINRGYNSKEESKMYGEGENFILSQETYGVNALLTFSAAINESATGTSDIARDKNNLFGHGAYDNCPYTCATYYNTVKDSIMAHASMAGTGYSSPSDWRYFGSHYGNKASGMNIKYASDPYWGEKAAMNSYLSDLSFGRQDYLSNTIGIKTSFEDVPIKKNPTDSSETIYTLKNKATSVSNIPVVITEKVYNDGTYWYKVYSDTALDENQNIASVNYNFNNSYGYIKANYLYVSNHEPVINASDISIDYKANVNFLDNVSASDIEDGDITSNITYIGNVDTNTPGEYKVTYTVEDSARFKTNKTITVTVQNPQEPIIEAEDKTLIQYKEYNLLDNIKASDYIDGDITNKLEIISDNVDINKIGSYKVIYKVTNSSNKSVEKEITVNVIENKNPVIDVNDTEISLNSTFNPLNIVSAYDNEDGNITSSIKVIVNTVDTSKVGEYSVAYEVSDNENQKVTKTIKVTVKEKTLEERSSNFYLDYLKEVNGKLELKGFNTINGINNNLDTNIVYEVVFENIDTNEELTFKAKRITDKAEISRPVFSNDGKDYTYSWFKYDFDFSNVPVGNYRMYVVSKTSDYYSKSIVNNKLYKEQATSYNDNKYILIHNNYNDKNASIELNVRNEELANKKSSYIYNQYDTYRTFEFTSEKLLHLKGVSYSYGANLSKTSNVERKIIFENISNYKTYQYNLGSITNGLYNVVLPVSDNLDKDRAWYDASIDISNIPKGKYVIYITTKSNITDIAEFTEKLNRSLDEVTTTINNKKYSFSINYNYGNRIELIVE